MSQALRTIAHYWTRLKLWPLQNNSAVMPLTHRGESFPIRVLPVGSLATKMMVLIAAKNSVGFAAGEHDMLHALDRLHVLRAFES